MTLKVLPVATLPVLIYIKNMLAYVFWHWRQPAVPQHEYETHLAGFHSTLAANPSNGFQNSVVFKIERASWLNTDGVVYEEWYVVDDSAALDPLNVAAVSGVCEVPHNLVARRAEDGIGGLYRWRDGVRNLSEVKYATWLRKPAGVSYAQFYAQLKPLLFEHQSSLWGRQMTLGPTAEFCIHSQSPVVLPDGFSGEQVKFDIVWPSA